MSSSKAHKAPSPPTVEQILEDLSAASDEDVIFKSVILEHGTRTKKELKEGKLADSFANFSVHAVYNEAINCIVNLANRKTP